MLTTSVIANGGPGSALDHDNGPHSDAQTKEVNCTNNGSDVPFETKDSESMDLSELTTPKQKSSETSGDYNDEIDPPYPMSNGEVVGDSTMTDDDSHMEIENHVIAETQMEIEPKNDLIQELEPIIRNNIRTNFTEVCFK